jgi:hypothetical protein
MSESKKTLSEFDINTDSVSSKSHTSFSTLKRMNSVVFAIALGGATLTSCADEKSCSDGDVTYYADGNGSSVYDAFDSYDYGGDTDTTSSGDQTGSGDACRDYD